MNKFKGITRRERGAILVYWGTLKGWTGAPSFHGYPEFRGTWHGVDPSEDVLIPGEFL